MFWLVLWTSYCVCHQQFWLRHRQISEPNKLRVQYTKVKNHKFPLIPLFKNKCLNTSSSWSSSSRRQLVTNPCRQFCRPAFQLYIRMRILVNIFRTPPPWPTPGTPKDRVFPTDYRSDNMFITKKEGENTGGKQKKKKQQKFTTKHM